MDRNDGSKRKRTRRAYTDEFRRSVVDHLVTSGESIAQVAAEFGISDGNLRMWKMRYGRSNEAANVTVPRTPEELARENQRLRKELARITTQRDILKKTISIVSEQSNSDIT
jgi:transposase